MPNAHHSGVSHLLATRMLKPDLASPRRHPERQGSWSALDVTVQAQIMDLLLDLQRERRMAMVLITHDLGVVAEVADHVAVMYGGRVVESGPVRDVLSCPAHPYTLALLESVPRADVDRQQLNPIVGSPPDMAALPSGCSFHPRCRMATDECRASLPP
ncbi:MAG: hypothetical protein GEU88_21270, partial [Solirubrobacterales bacterium]|nr:hypothetical protein [Solirubrobacterales bacterium]